MNQETETIETSFQLFQIVEDGQPFEPIEKVNGISGKYMSIERIEDNHDGTFPLIAQYIRLINRMENEGVSEFLNWFGGNA